MPYSHILQIDFVISPAFWKLQTITHAFSIVVYFPLLYNKVEIEAKYGNSIRHCVNIWMTLKELLPTFSITVKPFYGTIWRTGLIGSYSRVLWFPQSLTASPGTVAYVVTEPNYSSYDSKQTIEWVYLNKTKCNGTSPVNEII